MTTQSTQYKYADNKRRQVIDSCKKAIKSQFDQQCRFLKNREVYENDYTSEMFCEDMGKLIAHTQSQLNKLKLADGTFYKVVKFCHKGYGKAIMEEIVNNNHSSKCSCSVCSS